MPRRAIADDLECRLPGQLAHVRLWGSWKDDRRGTISKIRLRIHPDDPIGSVGPDKTNRYSKPRPEILWEKQCAAGQFEETSYHVASIGGLWWHDSVAGESAPGRTSRIWQIHIDVDPNDAFLQEGLPTKPQIYWLVVDVETVDGEFGWSTRQWPDHFGDGAVWGTGLRLALAWNETFYPHGHSYYDIERNSVDMAFCLLFHAEGFARATCEPTSVTQCPALSTRCPPAPTQCPAAQTSCPAGSTQCPASRTCCPVMQTVCPVAQTQCPGSHTQCPM